MEIVTRMTARKFSTVRMVGDGENNLLNIQEALSKAEDLGLDLVVVSATASPPVVRIQDFKKIEYEKKKAKKQASKNSQVLKELQFKVNISDHDLETKLLKLKNFLERGDKVKAIVRLKGRERETPQRAMELLKRIEEQIGPLAKVNRLPGPVAMMILEPAKAKPSTKKLPENEP